MIKRLFISLLILGLFIQADFGLAQTFTPNDPYLSKQWYLNNLQMNSVWPKETGNGNVVIAVIDSGVDIYHPDLKDNIWVNLKEIDGDGIDNDNNGYRDDINGWDFIDNVADPRPKYSADCLVRQTCVPEAIEHGTVISGVAAAVGNNAQGIAGMGWYTRIMSLRVLDENGSGSTTNVARAVDYAVRNKADIVNLSFISIYYDDVLFEAIQRAYNAGVLIVSAAGNEEAYWQVNPKTGKSEQVAIPINLDVDRRYPICYDKDSGVNMILGVAASDETNRLSTFSNYGSDCVDVVAPGQDIFGTTVYNQAVPELNQYYGGNLSGTSLAAPMVSGLAALIMAHKPDLTSQQIRDYIINNATNIDAINISALAGKMGHGLISPVNVFNSFPQTDSVNKLIKGADSSAVYYVANNGKRYSFPDSKVYFSWYDNYNNVKVVSPDVLAGYPLGGVVTYRPGSMVKIQTDPKVYVVDKGGTLLWLKGDQLPVRFFGANWASQVNDIPDSFFTNYLIGNALENDTVFDPLFEKLSVVTIDQDKGF